MNRGLNTLVSPKQVRKALARKAQEDNRNLNDRDDQDDARSILYDIDTQWGLLPHGGAYKESDHFYCESLGHIIVNCVGLILVNKDCRVLYVVFAPSAK